MLRKALAVITWRPEPAAAHQVLVLRLIEKRGGFWQSVTGHVEEGEAFEEGALREAEEETGLSFDRRPQYLGLEYEFSGKEDKLVHEKAYWIPLLGGSSPPPVTIDPTEHGECRWVSAAEAVKLVKFPGNKQAIERVASGVSPLFLSRGGRFFQDGEEITHERTALLLHQSLKQVGEHYLVRIGQEELEVVVEDTARFVKSFDAGSGEVLLSTGEKEMLDPATLLIRGDDSLTCRLPNSEEALFLSGAYYELTKSVREGSNGQYVLHFRGRDYLLSVAGQGEGMNR
jgi:8-oxo-dGTP pyrophosphatase MutT (NUDIX family)